MNTLNMTYGEVLQYKMEHDLTGISNPYAFRWKQQISGEAKPIDFNVLSLNVFRTTYGDLSAGKPYDCTNGGVTAKRNTVYIPCVDGPYRATQVKDQDAILFPEQRGPNYWALKPAAGWKKGLVGPMAGGNLAYSSDSRCKVVYHIHDRFETQEQYNSNSN